MARAGTSGAIPPGGKLLRFPARADSSKDAEVWLAQRDGNQITLLDRIAQLDSPMVLRWAADCVERADQLACRAVATAMNPKRLEEVHEAVVGCVAFARKYANDAYDVAEAERLTHALNHAAAKRFESEIGSGIMQAEKEYLEHGYRVSHSESFDQVANSIPPATFVFGAARQLLDKDAIRAARNAAREAELAARRCEGLPVGEPGVPLRAPATIAPAPAGGESAWQLQRFREYLGGAPAAQRAA